MSDLPAPPLPSDVDVRDLDGFMLNVERLMSSELWALSTGEEFKAAMALWCRAWKQLPAASLPNNERILANWAGVPLDRWQEIRETAMHGFVLCSDGRFYHGVLAQDAVRAFEKKKTYRERSSKANAKRWQNEPSSVLIGAPETAPENPGSDGKPPEPPSPIQQGSGNLLVGGQMVQQGLLEPPQGQGQGHKEEILSDLCPKPGKPVRTRAAYPADFEEFWKPYPTDSLMSKSDTAKAWAKLTKDDRASAIAAIPGFVAYCRAHPDYRPVHAVRFLTSRRFEGFQPANPAARGQPDAPMIDLGQEVVPEATLVSVLERGAWIDGWGPGYGQPGCKIPERLMHHLKAA